MSAPVLPARWRDTEKRPNSPGAVMAVGHACAHVSKAILELRQAVDELNAVRECGSRALVLNEAVTLLQGQRSVLVSMVSAANSLRLRDETPEEGP